MSAHTKSDESREVVELRRLSSVLLTYIIMIFFILGKKSLRINTTTRVVDLKEDKIFQVLLHCDNKIKIST